MDVRKVILVVSGLLALAASGVCQCTLNNRLLANNETFADCERSCQCVSGQLSCVPTCGPIRAPDCPDPLLQVPPGECCGAYVCRGCPKGKYGAACTSFCGRCFGGACDQQTGACLQSNPRCLPGFTGDDCSASCQRGYYGSDCRGVCGACGAGACNAMNGDCVPEQPLCKSGFRGAKCKYECPKGTWGIGCREKCSPDCSRACHPQNGTCVVNCRDELSGAGCERASSEEGLSEAEKIGLAVGVSLLLILLIVSLIVQLLLYAYRHPESRAGRCCPVRKCGEAKRAEEGKAPDTLGPCPPIPLERTFYETMLPSSNWRVKMDSLKLKKKRMVQGNFGETQLAKWHYTTDCPKTVPVGLKRVRGNYAGDKRAHWKKELKKLRSLERNINVLTVLGTAKDRKTGDTLLLLEWTAEGNLRKYLRRRRRASEMKTELSQENLIKLCLDVAQAMDHLSANKVHGVVLAAETILLDRNFDAKVTGFFHFKANNLSRDEKMELRERRRWAAPEYLVKKTPSSSGDVWGLGVLMWEVFSLGETPYRDFRVKDLIEKLVSGFRLSHPAKASTTMYVLMTECWQADATLRPSFSDIVKRLQEMPPDNLRNAESGTYNRTGKLQTDNFNNVVVLQSSTHGASTDTDARSDTEDAELPAYSDTEDAELPAYSDTEDAVHPAYSGTEYVVMPAYSSTEDAVLPAYSGTDDAELPAYSDTVDAVPPVHSESEDVLTAAHSDKKEVLTTAENNVHEGVTVEQSTNVMAPRTTPGATVVPVEAKSNSVKADWNWVNADSSEVVDSVRDDTNSIDSGGS